MAELIDLNVNINTLEKIITKEKFSPRVENMIKNWLKKIGQDEDYGEEIKNAYTMLFLDRYYRTEDGFFNLNGEFICEDYPMEILETIEENA